MVTAEWTELSLRGDSVERGLCRGRDVMMMLMMPVELTVLLLLMLGEVSPGLITNTLRLSSARLLSSHQLIGHEQVCHVLSI